MNIICIACIGAGMGLHILRLTLRWFFAVCFWVSLLKYHLDFSLPVWYILYIADIRGCWFEKDYFFDLDLETLILNCEGHILKTFETSAECKKVYDDIMDDYFNAIENKDKFIIVDFNKKVGI